MKPFNAEEVITLEDYYHQEDCDGDASAPVYSFYDHGTYACLSAPHATNSHIGSGKKACDLATGGITEYISSKYKISAVIRNKYLSKEALISSFVLENGLKEHFFLDIHAMHKRQPFELAVGTGYKGEEDYGKVLDCIGRLAGKYGIRYVINHPSYRGRVGFTGRLQKATGKANIVQLEWRNDMRHLHAHPDIFRAKTLPFLLDLITFVEEEKPS